MNYNPCTKQSGNLLNAPRTIFKANTNTVIDTTYSYLIQIICIQLYGFIWLVLRHINYCKLVNTKSILNI